MANEVGPAMVVVQTVGAFVPSLFAAFVLGMPPHVVLALIDTGALPALKATFGLGSTNGLRRLERQ